MTPIAFVFPGQGAQSVAMGASVLERFAPARDVMAEVDEALGEKLSALIADGPEDQLRLTENAQPALMAVSLAIFRTLEAEFGLKPDRAAFYAGHSLGEYSALAAAGALGLADCARLLRLRGQAMQAAAPVGLGAMASLIGAKVDLAFAEQAAAAGNAVGPCVVANDNNPGNIVISGAKAGVEAAITWAEAEGARAIMLSVSAPFHSPLMAPAAQRMAEALARTTIAAPAAPLYANVTAAPLSAPEAIRDSLVAQITGRVRWRESVAAMAQAGVEAFVEIGAGRTLTGMIKRIAPGAKGLSVSEAADLGRFAETWLA